VVESYCYIVAPRVIARRFMKLEMEQSSGVG
jgi:hypothetical protein